LHCFFTLSTYTNKVTGKVFILVNTVGALENKKNCGTISKQQITKAIKKKLCSDLLPRRIMLNTFLNVNALKEKVSSSYDSTAPSS
jgi:hypothetical protein